MAEPFTDQLLLDRDQVQTLLRISSRTQWKRFMDSPQGKLLPKPVSIGGSLKWYRDEVIIFVRHHLERTEVPKEDTKEDTKRVSKT